MGRKLAWRAAVVACLLAACGGTDSGGAVVPERDAAVAGKVPPSPDAGGVEGRVPRDFGDAAVEPQVELGDTACGEATFRTLAASPELLILLDRSRSMQAGGPRADLRCDNLSPFDVATFTECVSAQIDCSTADDKPTTYCGGTQSRGAVDRWTPSVKALKGLATQLDQGFRLDLLTFPSASNGCGPGDLRVPLGESHGALVAHTLDDVKVGGGTPTGESLMAAAQLFGSAVQDALSAPRYVLLVTDGEPTCPHAESNDADRGGVAQDRLLTNMQLDALLAIGVKTFVVGYDAAGDPELATALSEFAEHGGTDHYYPVEDERSLLAAFEAIAGATASCEYTVRSKGLRATDVEVRVDGVALTADSPDGFDVQNGIVRLRGAACVTLRSRPGAKVTFRVPCLVLR
jgi:hypothetical protein